MTLKVFCRLAGDIQLVTCRGRDDDDDDDDEEEEEGRCRRTDGKERIGLPFFRSFPSLFLDKSPKCGFNPSPRGLERQRCRW